MDNSDFVHLHVHQEFSLLDGLGSPEQYAEHAKRLGFPAIAITDHGNIDGHIQFQKACEKYQIDPIFGCELYVTPDLQSEVTKKLIGHLTILVKNLKGWQDLCRLLTIANIEGYYRKPRIDFNNLRQVDLSNFILMSACANSILKLTGGTDFLIDCHREYKNVYLEIMPHQLPEQRTINTLCLFLSQKHNIPLVATNDCHYLFPEQNKTQEVLLAIQRKAKWNDANRWKFEVDGLHLRFAKEMVEGFQQQGVVPRAKYFQAMRNTLKIASDCRHFRISKQEIALPETRYEKEIGLDANYVLLKLCVKGQNELSKNNDIFSEQSYIDRLNKELNLIKDKGFSRYFLVVKELIDWCAANDIMVGPGRGSSGGSLIAYFLGITQIDPLQYDLLFERFISEQRLDFPDIDLDFQHNKTDLVRQHLEEEYGKNNIAGISTFLRIKSRMAIRDIGRVFDLPAYEVDMFAKSIFKSEHEKDIIQNAITKTEEGIQFNSRYPEQVKYACELEGTIRSSGVHPSGIIISKDNLTTGERGCLVKRKGVIVSNWDMGDSEYVGLIKIDALKLNTLTVLNEAKKLIKGDFDYSTIPLDDSKVFEMLSDGNTGSIFQLSGYACSRLCNQIKIKSIEDIAAVSALARPGPADSGMAEQYIERKNGKKWKSLHPIYEEITKKTYGVVVFQEQMMKCMTELAGFSGSDADQIRKVIGKKRDPEEFKPYEKAFIQGCKDKKTLNKRQAEKFWEGLLKWAEYGFNKCVSGDTIIKGCNYTVEEMYKTRNSPWAYCSQPVTYSLYKRKNLIIPNKIKDIQYAGKQIVYRLTLENDAYIDVTANHKFPVILKWSFSTTIEEFQLKDLQIGDQIYCMGGYDQIIGYNDCYLVKIKRIEKIGEKNTYDVTMEGPNHNFVTDQGIVTCNSHAIAYSVIGYWCAWLKLYYEPEFLSAQLTYGPDKEGSVREAERLGYQIITPKIGISDPYRWLCKNKKLFMPFVEINGVGETQAINCPKILPPRKPRKGFFNLQKAKIANQLQAILMEIKAFDPDINSRPDNLLEYFQYHFS